MSAENDYTVRLIVSWHELQGLDVMLRTSRKRTHVHSHHLSSERPDAGFTLLELLVVMGIIALLASVSAPMVMGNIGKARTTTAKAQLSAISTALELYALDVGTYPLQQVGLAGLVQQPAGNAVWRGPYLKRADGLIDPWGRPYNYKFPGSKGGAEVYSLGRDNATGGTGEDTDVMSE